jgi:hypothetical protein
MQLTTIEEEILHHIHDLPLEKQQTILDFSLFIKSLTNPIQNTQPLKRQAGLAKGKLTEAFFEPLPESELASWEL